MYGAIDLSALAGQPTAVGGPAASGAVSGPYVLDVTPENVRTVLETSAAVPVVMVFFAESVEQSVSLTSQLEVLANEAQGHFQLGKVDSVAHPEVAQAFGVTGIPAAVAVMQGQPIPLFQGMPQEGELPPLVNRVLEAASQNGLSGVLDGNEESSPTVPERPPHLTAGLDALDAGDIDRAHAEFTQAVKDNPGDAESKVMLSQVELLQRVRTHEDPAGVLQAAAQAGLTDIELQLSAADIECYSRHAESAFARLIDVIRVTSGKERDRVRERLLELFNIVGADTPTVGAARRALASALF